MTQPRSDDEAFIRAVVDAPGDDAPRLVYADWLDERGDARGAFLRGELEWAAPWRAVEPPPEPDVPGPLAAALDPLWVLRVGRPPLGVCADHLTVRDAGPPVTPKDLDALERRLKLTLPPACRALLLNRNGGTPNRQGYRPANRRPDDYPDFIDWFFGVTGGPPPGADQQQRFEVERRDLEDATRVLNNGTVSDPEARRGWDAGVREFVAVAANAYLGKIAVGLTGRRAGKVYDINRPSLAGSSKPRLIAPSLPHFLALLRFDENWSQAARP